MKDGNLGLAEIHALNPYINIRLLQTREEVTFLTKMYTRNFLSLGSFYCLSPCPSRFKKKKNKQTTTCTKRYKEQKYFNFGETA